MKQALTPVVQTVIWVTVSSVRPSGHRGFHSHTTHFTALYSELEAEFTLNGCHSTPLFLCFGCVLEVCVYGFV